jgi:hypothetical protein
MFLFYRGHYILLTYSTHYHNPDLDHQVSVPLTDFSFFFFSEPSACFVASIYKIDKPVLSFACLIHLHICDYLGN